MIVIFILAIVIVISCLYTSKGKNLNDMCKEKFDNDSTYSYSKGACIGNDGILRYLEKWR